MKQYGPALADFDTALGLDPKCAAAYNNRGLAHAAQGRYDQAVADASAALRLDPSMAHPARSERPGRLQHLGCHLGSHLMNRVADTRFCGHFFSGCLFT